MVASTLCITMKRIRHLRATQRPRIYRQAPGGPGRFFRSSVRIIDQAFWRLRQRWVLDRARAPAVGWLPPGGAESLAELRRPFRFGFSTRGLASGSEWRALARRVEALGYSTLLVPDHIAHPLAPITLLAAAAEATTTL